MELEIGELYKVGRYSDNPVRDEKNALALYEIQFKEKKIGTLSKVLADNEIVLYIGFFDFSSASHRDVVLHHKTLYAIENAASYKPELFLEKL